MHKSLGFHILNVGTYLMHLLPLRFHYWVSDFVCFWVYSVFRYRRKMVTKNLKNSFPEKNEAEIKSIERKFYHNFTDTFVEILYMAHATHKRDDKHVRVLNREVIDDLNKRGYNILCATGHFGNWEFANLLVESMGMPTYLVYKKINNRFFEEFTFQSRKRMGGYPIEMRKTAKHLMTLSKNGGRFIAYMISDQRPQLKENAHWMTFLNQDSPVLMGVEKIAKKTNSAVVWMETRKVKRGHYEVTFELITDNAAATAESEITECYMRKLETAIRNNPDQWLWTHNRWKHKRVQQNG